MHDDRNHRTRAQAQSGRRQDRAAESERRRRIRIALAAYAYEILDRPIMTDTEYDKLAYSIFSRRPTGHPVLDRFFLNEFHPATGQWIHRHPELDKIEAIYKRVWGNGNDAAYPLPSERIQRRSRSDDGDQGAAPKHRK